jgi:hypothetical protein
VVRSTKRNSKKDVERPPDDGSEGSVESSMDDDEVVVDGFEQVAVAVLESLMDDDEVVVDGFQRVAVAGLEVMTFDGVLRARTLGDLEEERQGDDPRG